jgi:lambda repressor-like predicted transcriptional regulator
MSKETWFSAERALEVGLIDGIINADEYITEENVQAVEARMRTFSNPPMAIMNSIQKIKASMQNEIEKPEVKTSLLDKIVNAITSVFKAQTNEGHEEEEEKEEEAIVENSENSDNMTKEEMIEALKAAGYEVKSMEEEKEEKKEEEMTEEEMIAALEEAGMKVKKEATNEVVAEQTNELDSKFAEMQEEIARLKALANKPKIEQKAQKEEAPVDARTAMLERIAERCKVPMNQLNEGIKGFF